MHVHEREAKHNTRRAKIQLYFDSILLQLQLSSWASFLFLTTRYYACAVSGTNEANLAGVFVC